MGLAWPGRARVAHGEITAEVNYLNDSSLSQELWPNLPPTRAKFKEGGELNVRSGRS